MNCRNSHLEVNVNEKKKLNIRIVTFIFKNSFIKNNCSFYIVTINIHRFLAFPDRSFLRIDELYFNIISFTARCQLRP